MEARRTLKLGSYPSQRQAKEIMWISFTKETFIVAVRELLVELIIKEYFPQHTC
jgi:hypothetical protein